MSNTELSREELINKLATLESELRQVRRLMEATKKIGWWKRFGAVGAKVAIVVLMVMFAGLGVGGADYKPIDGNAWMQLGSGVKLVYVNGFMDGVAFWKTIEQNPRAAEAFWQCWAKWPPPQVLAIVEKYLKDNPNQWDQDIIALVPKAIIDACKKR